MDTNRTITRNGVFALSILGANLVVGLYDLASHGGKNVLPQSPQWLKDWEFPIFMVATPLILLAMGFVVAHTITGNPRGYLGVGALGILFVLMNVEPTITRMQAFGAEHGFVCLVNAAGGVLTAVFAYRAHRETRHVSQPSRAEDRRVPQW